MTPIQKERHQNSWSTTKSTEDEYDLTKLRTAKEPSVKIPVLLGRHGKFVHIMPPGSEVKQDRAYIYRSNEPRDGQKWRQEYCLQNY